MRRCDIACSVHFDASVSANKMEACNWRKISSLRHLRFQNCSEGNVRTTANNLFADDLDIGMQSPELMSCKNISEDFPLSLNYDVVDRLKWSF
ncbi:hypothetical protein BD410DRAFT_297958 [Rickenella mellea]|uniref:Uncharacterized protein n=1 Tax=Rickenella mellea TaxID=50990 RepID=A0A4Y7PG43_9AGAM|nr:hypothetical protein BD410DRAFT_297958 [Rickenella mellea]